MVTLPTLLAQPTKYTRDPAEMTRRVLRLYKNFIRAAPEIVELYETGMPISAIKSKIRQEFERHRFVQDIGVRNVLLMKGQMEYQETLNFWKQQAQFMKYFKDEEAYHSDTNDSFLQKFLKGSA